MNNLNQASKNSQNKSIRIFPYLNGSIRVYPYLNGVFYGSDEYKDIGYATVDEAKKDLKKINGYDIFINAYGDSYCNILKHIISFPNVLVKPDLSVSDDIKEYNLASWEWDIAKKYPNKYRCPEPGNYKYFENDCADMSDEAFIQMLIDLNKIGYPIYEGEIFNWDNLKFDDFENPYKAIGITSRIPETNTEKEAFVNFIDKWNRYPRMWYNFKQYDKAYDDYVNNHVEFRLGEISIKVRMLDKGSI